ncbi:HNH endonuclease [Bacillus toyonensis]|uniref:HNH endonuclease n=1 Tax=Bacillus toyonensis TaxID=155322 RepID=UPI000BED2B4D|nr:HNH endonuclease [Bacillus toyonensis]PDZ28248.1 HNH endonuclease [Bacillus toyonensis]
MVAPKDEHLALSSGIGLAGFAVTHFADAGRHIFENFRSEIIDCIVKPNKVTAVHYYLRYLQDISKEIDNLVDNIDDMELVYDFILRTLDEVGMIPDLPEPDFDNCTDKDGHYECDCNNIIKQWVDFVEENENEIDELIIHSAFQIIFLDRKFLHDFHLELVDFIEDYIDEIQEAYPENVTKKGRIKRTHFPKWLTNAVFYRDKGTCTICRCDLSNLIRTQNTIHIDHIVPLDVFGSNDASNFQLLCETCNTSKGARSTETSSINVPFWN